MESKHKTFRRFDGVVGVGYSLMFAGVEQLSVAWPDCEAKRYIADDLARHGVEEVVPVEQLEKWTIEPYEIAKPLTEEIKKQITDSIGSGVVLLPEGAAFIESIPPLTLNELETLTSDPPKIEAEQTSEALPQTNGATPEAPGIPGQTSEAPPISEAQHIRNYIAEHGSGIANKGIVAALKANGVNVTASQVARAKAELSKPAESAAEQS